MVCGPGSFYCTHVDGRNGENFNKGLLYITSHTDRVRETLYNTIATSHMWLVVLYLVAIKKFLKLNFLIEL